HLDADETIARLACPQEVANAASGFEDRGVTENAEPSYGLVHGGDDGGRGVEGVEGGAAGAVVFFSGPQCLPLFAECLPARVLVASLGWIREKREGNRTETAKAGERFLFFGSRRPLLLLDGFQRADGGEDVAGLRFFPAGDRGRGWFLCRCMTFR